jgi:hypothetical protein
MKFKKIEKYYETFLDRNEISTTFSSSSSSAATD